MSYVCNHWFSFRYWLTNHVQIKRPTTGLLMYTMATRFCDEIHLYGFWPFAHDPDGKPVKYHYYDTLTYHYTSSASPHTMPLEFRTLSALHRQGALRLHTGPCKLPTWAFAASFQMVSYTGPKRCCGKYRLPEYFRYISDQMWDCNIWTGEFFYFYLKCSTLRRFLISN